MRTALHQCLPRAVVLVLLLAITVSQAAPAFAPVTAGRATVEFGVLGNIPAVGVANTACKDRGGILPADYSTQVQTFLTNAVKDNAEVCRVDGSGKWTTNCYGVYTAGYARGSDCGMLPRENYIPDPLQPGLWQKMCAYRWDVGLFSRFNNSDAQPGVKFHNSAWADLRNFTTAPTAADMNKYERYIDDPSPENVYQSGPLNGFTDKIMWNASFQCDENSAPGKVGVACIAPHGNAYVGLGVRQLSSGAMQAVRVDVGEMVSATNIPFARANVALMCQWQGVEAGYYDSTAAPYAAAGAEQRQWAQRYWYVIFIIIAAVILIILFAILIYCTCCSDRGAAWKAKRAAAQRKKKAAERRKKKAANTTVNVNPLREDAPADRHLHAGPRHHHHHAR